MADRELLVAGIGYKADDISATSIGSITDSLSTTVEDSTISVWGTANTTNSSATFTWGLQCSQISAQPQQSGNYWSQESALQQNTLGSQPTAHQPVPPKLAACLKSRQISSRGACATNKN
jgi:hypothetical protein